MIETMSKIEIIGLIDELEGALDLLQEMGTVQIEEIPTVEGKREAHLRRIHLDESRERLLGRYEELLQTVRELIDSLENSTTRYAAMSADERAALSVMSPDELSSRIAPAVRDIRRLARQKKNLEHDMASARQYEELIKTFLPLLERAAPPKDMEQIGVILRKGEAAVLQLLRNRISEITGPKTVIFYQELSDGQIGVFVMVAPGDLEIVRELLGNEGVDEYRIPREFRRSSFQESIESIKKRIGEIPGEIEKIERELGGAKRANFALLSFIRALSTNRMNQLRILSRLVRTKHTFIVSGWTPTSTLSKLERRITEKFGDRVYIGKVGLTDYDFVRIPTLISNRGFFRASEVLMKLLPPPQYGNIDATPFIAFFFPLFFGIILGDIAYGLVLMAIAGVIKHRAQKGTTLDDIGTLGLIMSGTTMFFGIIFGEFLGDFGMRFGLHPLAPWLHRETATLIFLLMSIGIGVLHILLGLALKIYISLVVRYPKGAVEGASKIAVVTGAVMVFAELLLGLPPVLENVGLIVIVAGLLGVFFTEGPIGLLELVSLFGNILSYSRIMAIGLASVILAVVANRLAEATNNIILAILIGFVIHSINFIMGVFSPTIHALRLHYVEFFSKFFSATGKAFQPFKKIEEDIS